MITARLITAQQRYGVPYPTAPVLTFGAATTTDTDAKKPLALPSSGLILGVTALILAGLGAVYYMYKNPVEYDRYGRRVRA